MRNRYSGRASSMPVGLAIGTGISMLITLAASAILSLFLKQERLPWDSTGYGVMVILLAASFVGALTAGAKVKHQKSIICLLTGAAYYGVLLVMTALLFGGKFEAVGVTGLLIFAGSSCAVLLNMGKERCGMRIRRR